MPPSEAEFHTHGWREELVRCAGSAPNVTAVALVLVEAGFRNSMLEDLHAGVVPASAIGDYTDVKGHAELRNYQRAEPCGRARPHGPFFRITGSKRSSAGSRTQPGKSARSRAQCGQGRKWPRRWTWSDRDQGCRQQSLQTHPCERRTPDLRRSSDWQGHPGFRRGRTPVIGAHVRWSLGSSADLGCRVKAKPKRCIRDQVATRPRRSLSERATRRSERSSRTIGETQPDACSRLKFLRQASAPIKTEPRPQDSRCAAMRRHLRRAATVGGKNENHDCGDAPKRHCGRGG